MALTKSRIGRKPIEIPNGVTVSVNGDVVSIKGAKGEIAQVIHPLVQVELDGAVLRLAANDDSTEANALAGTMRALLGNYVHGVANNFTEKLVLVGVGYKVKAAKDPSGNEKLELTLGFSHPVEYIAPKGIKFNIISQIEFEIIGIDKQIVGQVAADIIRLRPTEPYKGKGVRKASYKPVLKETKKKK